MIKGPISVLIADDSSLFRQALASLLADDKNIQIMGEANNGKEVIDILERRSFDVILLDIDMPILGGIQVTEHINKHFSQLKILILTQYDDSGFIIELMRSGAHGYLIKDYTNKKELIDAINMVYNNGFFFNDHVSMTLLQEVTKQKLVTSQFNADVNLREIEREVLRLICQEKTSKEIADELFRSKRTIEDIRQQLMQKIGVKSVVGLVIYALQNGIT